MSAEFIYGKLNKEIEKVTYEGEKTDTIDVVVDNENRTISANLIKDLDVKNLFNTISVGDKVKRILFNIKLECGDVVNYIEEIVGELEENQSTKSCGALGFDNCGAIQWALNFRKSKIDQNNTQYIIEANYSDYDYLDTVFVAFDLETPSEFDGRIGFNPFSDNSLTANGELTLNNAETILKIVEDDDKQKENIILNHLTIGGTELQGGDLVEIINGDESYKSNTPLDSILSTEKQTLSKGEQEQVLDNLGITFDEEPTEGSNALLTSGAIYDAIQSAIQDSIETALNTPV